MKRLSMILLSIIIFIGATTSFAAECGDVDGTEGINILDVVFIINYIYKDGPVPNPLDDADIDGTSPINILDIVHLINYIYKDGPFPYCNTVTDIDGNVYQTITIGTQVWMMENLKVTHYRSGDPITHVTDNGEWGGLYTEGYCEYNNNIANVATYGRLYNWYAVDDSRSLAPEGWHVPTDEEWKQLEMYLGMSRAEADDVDYRGTDEGGMLKETGTTHWESPNIGATNESGFTALPGGMRTISGFFGIGGYTRFWSATEFGNVGAWRRHLDYYHSKINRTYFIMQYGFSVRCVRD